MRGEHQRLSEAASVELGVGTSKFVIYGQQDDQRCVLEQSCIGAQLRELGTLTRVGDEGDPPGLTILADPVQRAASRISATTGSGTVAGANRRTARSDRSMPSESLAGRFAVPVTPSKSRRTRLGRAATTSMRLCV